MGQVGDGTVVAPFANEAMRLLREDWKGKYGSKMLAEELFPILQTGIPNPDQNFQNFITINAGDTGSFAQLIDKFGNKLFEITAADGLKPVEPPGYPPPKLRPRIVWGPHTITAGSSISGTELDAVAVDPETGATIAGVYVYDPPSGTTFSSAGTATLYVNFTPTDGVKYRRAMGSTVLTITGGLVPDITWADPADITVGTALSGTQLDATATDPVTFAPVPGIFTYTPPSGTVLSAGTAQVLHVDFVPTDTVTYSNASKDVHINVLGFAFIHAANQSGGIFDTSITKSFSVTAGHLVAIFVVLSPTTSGGSITFALMDSDGNSYTQEGGYVRETQTSGTDDIAIAFFWTVATVTHSVTLTLTPSAPCNYGMLILEYSGNHASPFIAVSTNSEHQPTGPTHLYTTTSVGASAGNLVLGGFVCGNSPTSVTSPFINRTGGGGIVACLEDLLAPGAEAASYTGSAAGDDAATYVAIGVAFKKA